MCVTLGGPPIEDLHDAGHIWENDEWIIFLDFDSGYGKIEISAIWQKFLPFGVKFSIFSLNRAHMRKRWICERSGTLLRICWCRNFCDITEISAIRYKSRLFSLRAGFLMGKWTPSTIDIRYHPKRYYIWSKWASYIDEFKKSEKKMTPFW